MKINETTKPQSSENSESSIDQKLELISNQINLINQKKSDKKLKKKIDLQKENLEKLEECVTGNAQVFHVTLLEERVHQLEKLNISSSDESSSDSSDSYSSDVTQRKPINGNAEIRKMKKKIKKLRTAINTVNANALERDQMQVFYDQVKDSNMLERINRTERNVRKLKNKIHKINGHTYESNSSTVSISTLTNCESTEITDAKLRKEVDDLKASNESMKKFLVKFVLSSPSGKEFEEELISTFGSTSGSSSNEGFKVSSFVLNSFSGKTDITPEYNQIVEELRLTQKELKEVKELVFNSSTNKQNNDQECIEMNNQNRILEEIEDAKARVALLESGTPHKTGEVPKLFVDLPPTVLGHIQLVFRNQ